MTLNGLQLHSKKKIRKHLKFTEYLLMGWDESQISLTFE